MRSPIENKGFEGFPPLPTKKYSVIYADPPWDYKGQLQHNGFGGRDTGGALRHYHTVKLDDLKGLSIENIAADNAVLFMWSSSPHLDQAIDLGQSWGFDWKTVAFVWDKVRVNPGFYTMSQCELCLAFQKGSGLTPEAEIEQLVSKKRGKHSEKPVEVRDKIHEMFPSRDKIELFSRVHLNHWDIWGLEVCDN